MNTPDRSGPPGPPDAVRLEAVSKRFGRGDAQVTALREVNIRIPRSTFTAVMGPSGSGKSTLLHCAAGLDRPSTGRIMLAGKDIGQLREPQLTVTRRRHVGFVFQSFNLIPALTVLQNVLLPGRLAGVRPDRRRALDLLAHVGLAGKTKARPSELSGGQQQRVAVARALASQPDVIFGDEPTGALDISAGREVLGLLRQAVDEAGATIVMVTHDPTAAAWADRVIFLADGQLAAEESHPTATQVASRMAELSNR
jgi:putative ABC transport system ATP-binding protein